MLCLSKQDPCSSQMIQPHEWAVRIFFFCMEERKKKKKNPNFVFLWQEISGWFQVRKEKRREERNSLFFFSFVFLFSFFFFFFSFLLGC